MNEEICEKQADVARGKKIILWRRTENLSENNTDEEAKSVFEILTCLKEYGRGLSPEYTTAYSKESAEKFILTYENVYALLRKKDLSNRFVDKTFSFFSDKNDENCAGISFGIGKTGKRCPNTLIIHLPTSGIWVSPDFENLFFNLICRFKPYYACVADNSHKGVFWAENLPTAIHWMNFFDSETIENFNISKEDILKFFEEKHNGYFLKITSADNSIAKQLLN